MSTQHDKGALLSSSEYTTEGEIEMFATGADVKQEKVHDKRGEYKLKQANSMEKLS